MKLPVFSSRFSALRPRRASHARRASCDHSRLHSGIGKYSPDAGAIRFVVVCDDCGAERHEVAVEPYAPRYEPGAGHTPGAQTA